MFWSVDLTGGMTNIDWSRCNIGQILLVIWLLESGLCVLECRYYQWHRYWEVGFVYWGADFTGDMHTEERAACTKQISLVA